MHPSLEMARKQIEFAREYTETLLEDVSDSDWFVVPNGAVSHIAWQVGHITMAQYGLTLMRIRDRQLEDKELIPKEFMRAFMKGTTPVADATKYPPVGEIRQISGRVFQRCLIEMPSYTEEMLNQPLPMPTAGYPTKLGSILFCPMHEMLHAGQIGTIRRMLGKDPVR